MSIDAVSARPGSLALARAHTKPRTMRSLVWRRFRQNPLAIFGLVVLGVLALVVLTAPLIAPDDPDAVAPRNALQSPNADHWLGTDDLGRDVLSRLIYAARISLSVGVIVSLIAVVIGSLLGALAGYYGRLVDATISRFIDVILSLPLIPLLLVIGAFIEITAVNLTLMLGVLAWTTVARLVRGEFLALRAAQFTEAARAVGVPSWRIILVHLMPNALAPVIVAATLLVAFSILAESALSFLGFGIQPPTATWGNMLFNAQRYVRGAAWLAIFPGALITVTVMSINFVGDGLREAIDPRLKLD
ncbi:MAG: ABC transporter permease [Thermomicrobiales bacterium]